VNGKTSAKVNVAPCWADIRDVERQSEGRTRHERVPFPGKGERSPGNEAKKAGRREERGKTRSAKGTIRGYRKAGFSGKNNLAEKPGNRVDEGGETNKKCPWTEGPGSGFQIAKEKTERSQSP